MSQLDLGGWAPTEERIDEILGPGPAAALHALLDAPGPPPGIGDPLPVLWSWLYFLPAVAQAGLGPDGHPQRGSFLPPVDLPRRMFVGGRITVGRPPLIGDPATRVGVVRSVTDKTGRSGTLVFLTVGYDVNGTDDVAIHEEQDLVYRPTSGAIPPLAGAEPAVTPIDEGPWSLALDLAIDPVVLFRFSALTYNAHRIHYDRAWATEVEGYPGLVVHGPLQAIALAELCRRRFPTRPVIAFSFRAVSPAFDQGPLRLRGQPAGDGTAVELQAFDVHGATTMTATATLAPA